ncbi:endopygalactorunase [Thermoclostridium stercorarium subsp. leptospartum DSM 9219]|uniref:Endopygalactorunase n=1 Tax=Thermoclostridium stercorarium subsp. leptospartum DSM 9219 TaxID=1346611 RepID=A0A1B1YJ86_THEST|nr:glycoside hydrolase family 28 protein [Thermoclostridium stercorarium]ANX00772.1 endopygalactorunase [Thermoclostridium stercorarium subsp. leptospartum DSM 9219]
MGKVNIELAVDAAGDGRTDCSNAIQRAIDTVSASGGGKVYFRPGIYLTGSIFLKSGVTLEIGEGVELRGIIDETAYPDIWTRVAGIEMEWPAGLINVIGQANVTITGKGTIDGQGFYWWNKYWGEDRLGGMRKEYTGKGLRWAVDYDCKRPRNILIYNSSQVTLRDLTLRRSPFWNVHICYSTDVYVSGLVIKDNEGPSTDGIDVDSSRNVLIENCNIECNDDNICIKAGRDADGLRVNRPSENIVVRNCSIGSGAGVTIGSETSGSIRNVEIYQIKANGTDGGFRIKSALTRGGVIENVRVHDFEMVNVLRPFIFQLNWNPSYSYASLPENWKGNIPAHWKVLTEHVPEELGIPTVRNIEISGVVAKSIHEISELSSGKHAESQAMEIEAHPSRPITWVKWKNVYIEADKTGYIENASDWTMENVTIRTRGGEPVRMKNCVNVQAPKVEKMEGI